MTTVLPLVLSKHPKKNKDLNLPEAAAGAGVLSTISDVISPSCTSVFIVKKNKTKVSDRKTKSALHSYMFILNEF